MTDGGAAVAELHGRIEETGWDGIRMPTETTKGFVNNNDSPKSNTRLEIVNNRDSSTRDAHAKFVNNNIEVPKMENQFEDEGDEFD